MKKSWRTPSGSGAGPVGPGGLARAKTGPESIRGRISSPIPIPNPLDDEFPMRNPGTGIAMPGTPEARDPMPDQASRPEVAQPQPQPQLQSPPPPQPQVVPSSPVITAARTDAPSHESMHSEKPVPSPLPPPSTQSSPPRKARTSGLRQSTMSMGSEDTGSAKAQPQRKKSTLRGALGRLFGRKKKNSVADASTLNGGQSPVASTRNQTKSYGEEHQRTTSFPVSQYNRALRSHSVGPEDVLAIESARNSFAADVELSKRRTNGTDNYHLHTRRATDGGWTGLSPRPASSQGRVSRQDRHSDPDEIGRAITCDMTAKRRRSRSLSGLPGVEEDRDNRRRSDEIRYWRQSYDPNFTARPTSGPDDQEPGAQPADLTGSVADDPPKTPLQPFSFGNLSTMNELAGMKITQAASMDTRIGDLESRMLRMENVVTQLANSVPNFKLHESNDHRNPHTSAMGLDLKASTRPSTQHSDASRTSFGEATYVASSPRPVVMPAPVSFHRPLSISTIRGATSLPTIPKEMVGPFTMEHYVKLMDIIDTERSARHTLEGQVKTLSRQIDLMSRYSVSGRRSEIPGDPPPTGKSFGEKSVFDHDDDDDDRRLSKPYRHSLIMEDSGFATGNLEDDDYSENFITPHEEANGFSAIGDGYDDDDVVKRKASRTMSLSQMTINKTMPRTIQESPPTALSP